MHNFILYFVSDKVTVKLNIFGSFVKDVINGYTNGTDVITKNDHWLSTINVEIC